MENSRCMYKKLGQYEYGGEEIYGRLVEIVGAKYVYIGQVMPNTNKREGVGIMIFVNGNTIY